MSICFIYTSLFKKIGHYLIHELIHFKMTKYFCCNTILDHCHEKRWQWFFKRWQILDLFLNFFFPKRVRGFWIITQENWPLLISRNYTLKSVKITNNDYHILEGHFWIKNTSMTSIGNTKFVLKGKFFIISKIIN